MAKKRKNNKKERLIDEFGDLRMPRSTNQEKTERLGIIQTVYDRNSKNKKIKDMLIKAFVAIVTFILFIVTIAGPLSLIRTNYFNDKVDALSSPAFKTKYDLLGAEVIRAYYAHKQPNVNIFNKVTWPGLETNRTTSDSILEEGSSNGGEGLAGADANVRERTSNANMNISNSGPVIVENISFINGEQVPFIFSKEDERAVGRDSDNTLFIDPIQENLQYTGTIDGKKYTFSISLAIPQQGNDNITPYLITNPVMTTSTSTKSINVNVGTVPPESEEYISTELSPNVMETIDNWVSSYAEDDRESLKRLSGDTDPNTYYVGLSNFSLIGRASLDWAYNVYPDGDQVEDPFTIARITFQLQSKNSTTQDGVNTTFAPLQSMDIMLRGAQTGIPNIVAWQPAGYWQNLSSNMNALTNANNANPEPTITNTPPNNVVKQSDNPQSSAASTTARNTSASPNVGLVDNQEENNDTTDAVEPAPEEPSLDNRDNSNR